MCEIHASIVRKPEIWYNAWVTVNNDFIFWSRVRWLPMTIIDKSNHEWPKIVIHGYDGIILISYTLFYVLNTQFRLKQSSIAHFLIVTKDGLFWRFICAVKWTRGTGIVT